MTDAEVVETLAMYIERFDTEMFPDNPAEIVITGSHLESEGDGFVIHNLEEISKGFRFGRIKYDDESQWLDCYFLHEEDAAKQLNEIKADYTPRFYGNGSFTDEQVVVAVAAHEVRHRKQRSSRPHEPFLYTSISSVPFLAHFGTTLFNSGELHKGKGFTDNEFDAAMVEYAVARVLKHLGRVPKNLCELIATGPSMFPFALCRVLKSA